MTKTLLTALLAGGLACALASCDDNTPACVPDSVRAGCICPTGNLGHEICTDDGLEYGACLCDQAPLDGGGGGGGDGGDSDGGIATDAPASPDDAADAVQAEPDADAPRE